MAEKLKIYACSGIGAAQAEKPIAYWTDNTRTISNTQAVNSLLALINTDYIKATRLRGLSKEDKLLLFNDIDMLTVCLDAASRFSGKPEMLHKAGMVIGHMVQTDEFNYDSLDGDQRDANLDELIDDAHAAYDEEAPQAPADFMSWWHETVELRDKVGLTKQQQDTIAKAAKQISGIGKADDSWKQNADLAEYLTKGGTYFLYCFFTPDQLAKLPDVFKKKRDAQIVTYNYCKALFVSVYGSEAEMTEIIRAGIIDEFGDTAENVCAEIMTKANTEAVGISPTVIVAIISAVSTVIVGIITAVCTMVAQTNVAKYASIDRQAVEASTPNEEDFAGLNISSEKVTSWLPLAAIGVGLIFLLKS